MVLTFEWVSACPLLGFCLALRGQHGCKRLTFLSTLSFSRFICSAGAVFRDNLRSSAAPELCSMVAN